MESKLESMNLPWHPKVTILRYQNQLWGVEKPCGILSHPNKPGICFNSIIQANYNFKAEAYVYNGAHIYLLNRLDSPTSGVVLLSTDTELTEKIRRSFKLHQVKKIYQAFVKGRFPGNKIFWKDFLSLSNEYGHLRTFCKSNDGILAKTEVRLLKTFTINGECFSWIKLYPITGRTHQLRAQCSQHHFPILGDKVYGDFCCNRRFKTTRLYLHAQSIALSASWGYFEVQCDSGFENLHCLSKYTSTLL